jgi:hypothetical protein
MTGLTIPELKCIIDTLESSIETSSWDCLTVEELADTELMEYYALRANSLTKLKAIVTGE